MNRSRLRLFARFALLLLSLSLASCVVESKNPLSDPDTSKPDPRLYGQWRLVNEDKSTVQMFIGLPNTEMKGRPAGIMIEHSVNITTNHQISTEAFGFFVTTIGEDSYLNVFDAKLVDQAENKEWSKTKLGSVLPVKCAATDDKLSVWLMDLDATAKVVDGRKLKGEVKRTTEGKVEGVLLTDTTENLVAFLKAGGNKTLFPTEAQLVYSRVK